MTPMRFDRFMDAALHDPQYGYYAAKVRDVGMRGDFSTTVSISPILARAIAHWLVKAMKSNRVYDVIELGPGSGQLAFSIYKELPWILRRKLRLHLVETSTPLRKSQQKLLGRRAIWHESLKGALSACGGKACIYSNEFVDAFPVRRFRKSIDGWEESFVVPGEENWEPVDQLPESTILNRDFPNGQIVEVHESFQSWLSDSLEHWNTGRMLTVDYGAKVGELYQRQPMGSIRAYLHHQCLTGAEVLARPGQQDITADVNFTDLSEWMKPYAKTISLCTQHDFLKPFVQANDPAEEFAINPHGAGGHFLVLDSECLQLRESER